jgi:hypothetical protein
MSHDANDDIRLIERPSIAMLLRLFFNARMYVIGDTSGHIAQDVLELHEIVSRWAENMDAQTPRLPEWVSDYLTGLDDEP